MFSVVFVLDGAWTLTSLNTSSYFLKWVLTCSFNYPFPIERQLIIELNNFHFPTRNGHFFGGVWRKGLTWNIACLYLQIYCPTGWVCPALNVIFMIISMTNISSPLMIVRSSYHICLKHDYVCITGWKVHVI